MDNETNVSDKACNCGKECNCGKRCCKPGHFGKRAMHKTSHGCVYGLAFIGAAVYFLQNSHTFWAGVLGILKALVWPAFLIYKLLEFLKM
jgi:hypothetical protein